MKCPFCSYEDSKVIDSRPTDDNEAIRRRRECLSCNKRFTTYERYENQTLVVIKKDGTRQPYNRSKILNGMVKSAEKRPVPVEVLEKAIDEIETELNHMDKKEISSVKIGDMVMDKLKSIDQITYIRFASVYREFQDVKSFKEELDNLNDD